MTAPHPPAAGAPDRGDASGDDDRHAIQGPPPSAGAAGNGGSDEGYLWDRSGPPDPDVVALERSLGVHRWAGTLDESRLADAAPERSLRILAWRLAASVLLAGGAAAWWFAGGAGVPVGYAFEVLGGSPLVQGAAGPRKGDRLLPGERLVCDDAASARVTIGDIGSIVLEPGTALRVDDPAAVADAGHLLYLERGTLQATILAPPRVFQVGTPAGMAVDLGCVYSATVDEGGATRLRVTFGQVAFETGRRHVIVPHGASIGAVPGRSPGTPVWDDSPQRYRDGVGKLDMSYDRIAPVSEPALAQVLATERRKDSLTLWHLLDHPDRSVRARVFDRLAELVPAPEGVTRQACLDAEPASLARWKDEFDWAW